MKNWNNFILAGLLLSGCSTTRSISNSQYREPARASRVANKDHAYDYQGELNEFDVLGIARNVTVSDTEIERTLSSAKRVRLHPGSSVLLVQSGATFPDGPMVAELSKHFRVVPFSGVPPANRNSTETLPSENTESFSKALRLAAARGGSDMILCYWGILESENAKLATKTVSWVPVVNWVVPDERQHMRIRLKLALVDVRTGDWAILSPAPVDSSRISVSPRRNVADQKLVESLKGQAYVTALRELMKQYAEFAAK